MSNIRTKPKTALMLSNRIRLLLVLLCVGIAGILVVFFFRHLSNLASERFADIASYSNHGVITNLTEIFQIPALMFFGVLVAYALTELFKTYRAMNDPETYRNKAVRGAEVGRVAGRKAKRATAQKKTPLVAKSGRRQASETKGNRKRQTPLRPGQLPHIKDDIDVSKLTDVSKIPRITDTKEKS